MNQAIEDDLAPIALPKQRMYPRGMGEVVQEVILRNTYDVGSISRGLAPANSLRSLTLNMVVDTGCRLMYLPEDAVRKLGLDTLRETGVQYANGSTEMLKVAGPLSVQVGDRTVVCETVVGPPGCEPLLGQVPLELLDMVVDPGKQILSTRPESPYFPMYKVK